VDRVEVEEAGEVEESLDGAIGEGNNIVGLLLAVAVEL
jgi:hypothetical protein